MANDQYEPSTRSSIRIQDLSKTLLVKTTISPSQIDSSGLKEYHFDIPEDYFSYVKSNSKLSSTYKGECDSVVPNIFATQEYISNIIMSAYNDNSIMRRPYAVIYKTDSPKIHVYTDSYTNIDSIDLFYFKYANAFNVLTNTPCELPYECFEDLVEGAVALYITTLSGRTTQNTPKKEKEEDK